MRFPKKLSIFLMMIGLSSCATNPPTPPAPVIDKSYNPSSARADVDICNVNNISRKIASAESACFQKNPQFQSNLPTCDKSQHPYTWTDCFGVLENSGWTLQAEFKSGAPIRGLLRTRGNYYTGGFRDLGLKTDPD